MNWAHRRSLSLALLSAAASFLAVASVTVVSAGGGGQLPAAAREGPQEQSEREEKVDYAIARADLVEQAFLTCNTSDEQLPDGRDCLRDAFRVLIQEHGPLPIINGLGLYREENDLTCHDSMHVLGQAAYSKEDNLVDTYSLPKAGLCEYGYYHGVLQGWALAEGPEAVLGKFPTLCDALDAAAVEGKGDCIHASGHAVGIFLDADLANKACSTYEEYNPVYYCWYGYEMEYARAVAKEVKALTENDPEAARARATEEMTSCASYGNEAIVASCFAARTPVAHGLLNSSVKEMAEYCNGVGRWQKFCVNGFVGETQAVNTSLDNPELQTPRELCSLFDGKAAQLECYKTIAYRRLLVFNSYDAVAESCAAAEELEAECLRELKPLWDEYLAKQKGYFGTGSAEEVGTEPVS